jgi:transposase
MTYQRISKDLKESALRLWELGWEAEGVAFAFGVSHSSLYRWQAFFDEYSDVTRPPSPLRGPTRILTCALLTACEDLFSQESDLYLDEVVAWLALVHGLNISTSTLSWNLIEAGLTCKILQRLASEWNDELRCEWIAMVATEFTPDGSQLVFVDETSKNELTWARHYGRSPAGRRATITDVFIRGQRYSLAAAITADGYLVVDVQ